jgi:transcriptional regulator with XRE-family HTH domain
VLRKCTLTPEGSRSINEFAKWTGVANGTVDRIEKGETDPQISHLLKIAGKYQNHGIRPWHLLVAGLDPLAPPELITPAELDAFDAIGDALDRLRGEKGAADGPVVMPAIHARGQPPKASGAVHSLRRRRKKAASA